MKSSIVQLLKENGWTLECESPLEIRHDNGSFATMLAADIIIQVILDEGKDK